MRALVLSGGGSKGAFQVGAMQRLVGWEENDYKLLCGVSVGALVAAFMAQYMHVERDAMVKELSNLFLDIRNKDVWKHWFLVRRAGGLWKPSLLNSSPLQALVRDRLDPKRVRASGRHLRVGAVSLKTGRYALFSEDHIPLADAVLASASFPGFLAPVRIDDALWTDGGVQQITPIKAAIAAGATSIDVVITEPRDVAVAAFGNKTPNAVDILMRSLDIMMNRIAWVDVDYAMRVNDLVKAGVCTDKRYVPIRVIAPPAALNNDPLNFDPKEAVRMAATGYMMAAT